MFTFVDSKKLYSAFQIYHFLSAVDLRFLEAEFLLSIPSSQTGGASSPRDLHSIISLTTNTYQSYVQPRGGIIFSCACVYVNNCHRQSGDVKTNLFYFTAIVLMHYNMHQ